MKNILLFGAGLSAGHLIQYLDKQAQENDWLIHIVDLHPTNLELYKKKCSRVVTSCFGIDQVEEVSNRIKQADAVISMLPAFMHIEIAKHCITNKKALFTASYVSEDIKA
jgi:saccharopine dehydrogenase-like NADP-dependent oxidoreductase